MKIYSQLLPKQTATLVDQFQANDPAFLHDFYLSGGTGLTLQIGHRDSVDFDFFHHKLAIVNLRISIFFHSITLIQSSCSQK